METVEVTVFVFQFVTVCHISCSVMCVCKHGSEKGFCKFYIGPIGPNTTSAHRKRVFAVWQCLPPPLGTFPADG